MKCLIAASFLFVLAAPASLESASTGFYVPGHVEYEHRNRPRGVDYIAWPQEAKEAYIAGFSNGFAEVYEVLRPKEATCVARRLASIDPREAAPILEAYIREKAERRNGLLESMIMSSIFEARCREEVTQ